MSFFVYYRPEYQQKVIKRNCWSFFLEVLSSLCIDGKVFNEELVDTTIQAVFSTTESSKDDKLHIYLQSHTEELAYLQSFTIKLILQYE